MKLKTEGTFDAAHHLVGYKGKCANVHGHTWRVIVWAEGSFLSTNKTGILWDFTNLKKILDELDHTDLNEIFVKDSPTAENIAYYILGILKTDYKKEKLANFLEFKVRVYESPKSYVEVEG